jgi:drug/metabolite transporter (DMT)-like permease
VPFIAYTFWQSAIAAVLLLALSAATGSRPGISRAHLRSYTVTAVLGVVVPVLILVFVASRLPAAVVTLTITLTPGITYLYAVVLRLERARWIGFAGVALGLAGVLFIVLPDGNLPSAGATIWVIVLLAVPLCFATNNIFVTLVEPPQATALSRAAGLVIVASVITFPMMLVSDGFYAFWTNDGMGLWGVLWAGAINTITFFCMFEIIRRAGPVFFAQYNYVIVIAGVFWALLFFPEDGLSVFTWIAFAVMIGGLALSDAGIRQGLRERAGKAAEPGD